jgi:tRNA-splicing ligase RtcB
MGVRLPDRDLAYLPEDHPAFAAYLRDLNELGATIRAAQSQRDDRPRAGAGKARGLRGIAGAPADQFSSQLHTGRAAFRQPHLGRKGAVEARRSNRAMIPDSMGTRSYIVVGKEHPMSFHSAPHGAGRRYSRTRARALFGMDDLSRAMSGI